MVAGPDHDHGPVGGRYDRRNLDVPTPWPEGLISVL